MNQYPNSRKIQFLLSNLLTVDGLMKALEWVTNDLFAKASDTAEAAGGVLDAIKHYVRRSIDLANEVNDIDRKAGR
ncbi:MAG: hypothetical protein V6Z86_02275 [Hyphomicrobiales bacterium]